MDAGTPIRFRCFGGLANPMNWQRYEGPIFKRGGEVLRYLVEHSDDLPSSEQAIASSWPNADADATIRRLQRQVECARAALRWILDDLDREQS
jgi:hypothetical protein